MAERQFAQALGNNPTSLHNTSMASPRQPTAMQTASNYYNKYKPPAMDAFGMFQNMQYGRYLPALGNAQRVTAFAEQEGWIGNTTEAIQNFTGFTPQQFQNGQQGFSSFVNAPLSSYNALQAFNQGDYLNAANQGIRAVNQGASVVNSIAGEKLVSGTGALPSGTVTGLGALASGYNTIQSAKQGDYVGAGLQGVQAVDQGIKAYNTFNAGAQGANAAAQGSNAAAQGVSGLDVGIGDVGGYIGAANALYGGYNSMNNEKGLTNERRAQHIRQSGQRAVAAIATEGISEAVIGAVDLIGGSGTAQGAMDDYEDFAGSDAGKVAMGYMMMVNPMVGMAMAQMEVANTAISKVMGGTTKYAELKSLSRVIDSGYADGEDLYVSAELFDFTGGKGRGVDMEEYATKLDELGVEGPQAERLMKYRQALNDGGDAIEHLANEDLMMHGEVLDVVGDYTGAHFFRDLSEDQQNQMIDVLRDSGALEHVGGNIGVNRKTEGLEDKIMEIAGVSKETAEKNRGKLKKKAARRREYNSPEKVLERQTDNDNVLPVLGNLRDSFKRVEKGESLTKDGNPQDDIKHSRDIAIATLEKNRGRLNQGTIDALEAEVKKADEQLGETKERKGIKEDPAWEENAKKFNEEKQKEVNALEAEDDDEDDDEEEKE